MSGSSRAFFTLLDASGALVPGATVTVTVDGVTGAGTVTETSVGRYHYNLTHAEAAQSRRIFASAPLARPVEIFWQPTPDNAGVASARTAAETARDAAIQARTASETARTTAEATHAASVVASSAATAAQTATTATTAAVAQNTTELIATRGVVDAARTASEAVNARISTAGITVVPTLLPGMRLLLMRDFDYPSIDFADTSWPSLTGNVVTISIDGHVHATTVKSATAFQLTLTRAQTLALTIGLHPMHAEVLIGTQRRLLFTGICEVANVS